MNSQNLCEEVTHSETGQARITLTPLAIKSSSRVIYHVVGEVKARVISALLSKSEEKNSYPAAHIRGEWYLDQAAASYLQTP
jgi:6-phosphogluconolactonase/glucosamine-6-phosphate isomerase/deaminase